MTSDVDADGGSSSSSSSSGDVPEPEEVEGEAEQNHEDWVAWVKRTTHVAEECFKQAGLEDWVTAVRRKHWRWAGHLARREDGRWSSKLLTWCPTGRRDRGHPCKRWVDDLNSFFNRRDGSPNGCWHAVAQNREQWQSLEEAFVKR